MARRTAGSLFLYHRRLQFEPLEDRRLLANVNVSNLNDLVNGNTSSIAALVASNGGDGISLREAVLAANADAAADTIAFSSLFNTAQTITLTSGEIAIAAALTVDGPAIKVTISGNNASRIFNTSSAAAGTPITLQDLTLTAGNSTGTGGAMLALDEAVTLTNCVFSGNTAFVSGGAVAIAGSSGGTLTASDCSFSGNSAATGVGGAIANFAGTGVKTILQRCTVSGNTAPQAGGLFAGTYLLVGNSTISGNMATGTSSTYGGGGIRTEGIFAAGALTVRNSTISGNSTASRGGGMLIANAGSGTLVVQNSTITENTASDSGGGIARLFSGNISIESSVVSGNTNAMAPDISSAGTVSVKTSAIGSPSGFTRTDLGGNLPFQPHANLKIGSLANNGGPTLTHLPANDSPLVNAGTNPAALTTDQRGTGFPRVISSVADIGSVETRVIVVSNTNDSGAGSLRQAMVDANTVTGPDTVTFDPVAFAAPRTITLTSGEIAISDAVTITGPVATLTVSGNNASRIFNTTSAPLGTAIVFQGLTLTNGLAPGTNLGGAIFVGVQALTLQRCVITNSSARGGGAIALGGTLLIEDSRLSGNTATTVGGGAIRVNFNGSVTIRRSTLSGNTTADSGGAVYFYNGGNLTVQDSTLSGNTANSLFVAGGGGAVHFGGSATTFLISNSTLSGNSAPRAVGGAVGLRTFGGTAVFQNSTITGNSADTNGGGIARTSGTGTVSLSSTIVAGNTNANTPDLSFDGTTNIGGNNNLVGVANVGNFALTGTGNQTGTKEAPLNAKLGPLANNGGPTLTHMPMSDSPTFNKGNNAAGLPFDQRGSGFPRVQNGIADVGAVELLSPIPFASAIAADVTSAGGTIHTITVDYFDDVGINNATLGNSDITVNGPGGPIPVTFTGFTGGGTTVTATYTLVPPGGSWDAADNGTYSIAMNAGEVFDTDGVPHSVPAGTIGSFVVFFPIVSITADENDGNFAANDLSLREAIILANNVAGTQTITFDPTVFGTPQTITLTMGEIAISDVVTITGPAATLTVSGNNASRIFNTSSASTGAAIVVQGLTLTGGFGGAGLTDRGGAILVADEGLTLRGCAITNSNASEGGALSVENSLGTLIIEDCTITGNHATVSGGDGGAINVQSNASVAIRRSTLSGNTSADNGAAVYFFNGGSLAIEDSTLSGNTANSTSATTGGGAVYFFGTASNFVISNSTLSGNSAATSNGGAVCLRNFTGTATFQNSTITGNTAGTNGGGIARTSGTGVVSLSNTIVAGNTNANSPDLSFDTASNVFGVFSLIGVADAGNFTLTGTGNLTGTNAAPLDAKLGGLASNGGPTMTHALLVGSPAIDAGDPTARAGVSGIPPHDQRGSPYTRVFDGDSSGTSRIDMGAYELQVLPNPIGDYNRNTVVDAADYVLWRKTLGAVVSNYTGADGNGNGVIDQADHNVWRANFGNTAPPGAGSGSGQASSVENQDLTAYAPAADNIGESVVQIPKETVSASAKTIAAAARAASFTALEARPPGHDCSARSIRTIHRYQMAGSGNDDLLRLLAIDRVGRSLWQDSFVNDDSGNGEHRTDDCDSESERDKPLTVSLVVQRGARSRCILPG